MIFQKIVLFFKNMFSSKEITIEEDDVQEIKTEPDKIDSLLEEFLFLNKDNVLCKINKLRTEISRIEFVCDKEFALFSKKLDDVESYCISEYSDYAEAVREGKLVFTCDPSFNNKIKAEINSIEEEIIIFIENVGKYKVLKDRFEKLSIELIEYYEQYKTGSFKGDFQKMLQIARVKVTDLIERVIGSKSTFNLSQTFLEKKELNDMYIKVLYLIEKCQIYYMVTNDTFDFEIIRSNFKESFLVLIMKDLEEMRICIEGFKSTIYYNKLYERLQKIKSTNISNIEYVLKNKVFFIDFVILDKSITKAKNKLCSATKTNNTQALLNLLNS